MIYNKIIDVSKSFITNKDDHTAKKKKYHIQLCYTIFLCVITMHSLQVHCGCGDICYFSTQLWATIHTKMPKCVMIIVKIKK